MKILTVTGYKPMELNIFKQDDPRIAFIKFALEKQLIAMMEEGLEWVIISGQMGVELWAAEVVLDLKESYDIQLGIFPPFENQTSRWPENYQETYEELIMSADFVEPIYKGDYKGPYQFRAKNKWFVDKSDACLLIIDEEFPGSNKFFLSEAQKAEDYAIYMITPDDLDDAVTELQMSDPDYWS
ncbi:SLOG family protein [Virgibacillus halophilus]|uniref:SLOG family protein n=1 Tax=Tigheibacillus halophilus TaxID=361280 RepID=UPI00362B982C